MPPFSTPTADDVSAVAIGALTFFALLVICAIGAAAWHRPRIVFGTLIAFPVFFLAFGWMLTGLGYFVSYLIGPIP